MDLYEEDSNARIDATILGGPLTTPKGMAVHCFPSIAPASKLGPDCYSSCSSPKLSSLVAKKRHPAVNLAHNTKCTKCHNTHTQSCELKCSKFVAQPWIALHHHCMNEHLTDSTWPQAKVQNLCIVLVPSLCSSINGKRKVTLNIMSSQHSRHSIQTTRYTFTFLNFKLKHIFKRFQKHQFLFTRHQKHG